MPKMMKNVAALCAMLLVLGTGTVFAGGSAEQSDASDQVTIEMAFPVAVDAPITELLQGYADEFMALHPNVTVELVYSGGYTDVKTAIQTAIDGGGKAPALAVMLATDLFDLANAQYIQPIDDLLNETESGYIEDFLPAFMENSYYMDQTWSLPFQRSAVVLYYNADLLEEEGVPVPSNWAELAESAAALTIDGGATRWGIEWPTGWPYWVFQPLAMGAGQNIVGDSDSEVFFDNQAVISAIEYYNSLSSEYGATPAGVQNSWGNVVPNFLAGNTAMIVHTSGSLSGILEQADFTVGVMGVPGEDGGSYSVPGGGNIYLTSDLTDAERQAAFEFAVFLTDPSRAADFSIATGYIATRYSCAEDAALKAYIAEHPQVLQVQQALASAGKEMALQNLGEVRSIFHSYIQAAFNGEMSAAQAMAQAQAEADAALEDFR